MGYVVPIIAAVVAAGASYYNTRQVAKKQDQALAAGIREKAKRQQKADQQITETIDKIGGSSADAERQSALKQYGDALRGTEANAQAGQALAGLSAEYDAATTANQTKKDQYLASLTDTLSKMDAPGMQRMKEGFLAGNLGQNLSIIGREAEGIDYLARMKASNVRRNPWIDAVAAGLNAYAGGGSSFGGTTGDTKTGANYKGFG